MSISIRGTVTRPSADTIWPFHVFTNQLFDAHATFATIGGVDTLMKGDPMGSDLTVIIDHHFEDAGVLEANREALYACVPWWQDAENKAEVEAYHTANGITLTIEEITDPDMTGFVDLPSLPNP